MTRDVRSRVMLTLPVEMIVALDMLCEKTGLKFTTQATLLLRQALSQTINSTAGQERIRAAKAFMSSSEWRSEQTAIAQLARAVNYKTEELNGNLQSH